MLDFKGLLHHLSEKFNAAGVRYALIGGFALHAAGLTRATGDIDFLVHAEDAGKLKEIMLTVGYKTVFENDNVIHFTSPWALIGGVDVILARHQYTRDMLAHAVAFGDHGIRAVSPEGIIGLKVQAMNNDPERRARDMADIEWLIKERSTTMNMALVREYFELFNMTPQLNELLQRLHHAE